MPEQGFHRAYNPVQLIFNFRTSIWRRANCYEHLEVTHRDEVLLEIFGWERMGRHKVFQRYFAKFDQAINHRGFLSFSDGSLTICLSINIPWICTIMTRYGRQEDAAKGYNPKKRAVILAIAYENDDRANNF
jgi:hypothetical protein